MKIVDSLKTLPKLKALVKKLTLPTLKVSPKAIRIASSRPPRSSDIPKQGPFGNA
ncbi:MAG: hypothetical protein AAFR12_02595 [Cyanobacteria bacterium J06626_6]